MPPFFGRDERAIDKAFLEIQPATVLQVLGHRQEHLLQDARAYPLLETPMHGLVLSVPRGQVFPRRPGAQNPKHTIQGLAPVAPGSAAQIRAHRIGRKDCIYDFPLLIRQVHP